MVWFICDDCGDTIKKPQLKKHFNACSASILSCVDCGQEFNRHTVQGHTTCVTEHEKYALGATKPGGKASAFNGTAAKEKMGGQTGPFRGEERTDDIIGREYLATKAPWLCSCCNIECTGAETLKSHALGKKHKRKATTLRKQKEEGKATEEKPKKSPEEKKKRKEEKKRKREEAMTEEEKVKEEKKVKQKELKAAKREKKLARKKAKKEAKKNGEGKTDEALEMKGKGVKKKKKVGGKSAARKGAKHSAKG
jgi:cell growth-regulating nucleolar protein